MTTTELSPSEELAQKLQDKYNVPVEAYKRSPVAGAGFIVTRPTNNRIKIYCADHVEIRTRGSKRKRQCVISATEPKRTLRKTTTKSHQYRMEAGVAKSFNGPLNTMRGIRTSMCPIQVPNSRVTWRVDEKAAENRFSNWFDTRLDRFTQWMSDHEGREHLAPDHIQWPHFNFEVNWTISCKASTNHLLMGYDESATFVCMLPEAPNDLEHAYEILRPEGISADAMRQGEWFFVPVDEEEMAAIKKAMTEGGKVIQELELERGSTHTAGSGIKVGRQVYATGVVFDTRRSRHEPQFLDGWYKAVRNTEINVVNPTPRERASLGGGGRSDWIGWD